MIDVIRQQFKEGMTVNQKLNVAREFLQVLAMKIIDDRKLSSQIAFVGGTSLRLLYGLKRFSEDLDFSVIRKRAYNLNQVDSQLAKSFRLYGLTMESKIRSGDTSVHSIVMKFTGLLNKLGLSRLPGQKLSIKVEIDSNPPSGWNVVNTIVNRVYMFNVVHFDLPSLYACKLHACLFRKYTKGRDIYDLIWYLSRKTVPNFKLLNNAIRQTEGKSPGINAQNFKRFLLRNIEMIDLREAKKDVERFLEESSELNLFNVDMICDTIKSIY